MHQEVAKRLIEHLEAINITPATILDLGGAASCLGALLKTYFPTASIIAADNTCLFPNVDIGSWCNQSKQTVGVCCEPDVLPLLGQSVDLVISNLFLFWYQPLAAMLLEVGRVLKPEGLLLFSTLGPETLLEVKPNEDQTSDRFIDMHDIGDELIRAKFVNPVMEMEKLQVDYPTIMSLRHDIENWQLQSWFSANEISAQVGELSFEIIYGHAWGASLAARSRLTVQGDVAIPIQQIVKKK